MAKSAILRRGEVSDIDGVKACIDQAYMSYIPRIGKRPASMDTDFEPLLHEGRVWVLEYDSRIVGTMALIEGPGFLEIRSVAVLPEYQRKGLGQRLMLHAETTAREARCARLRLYTNAGIPELVTYYSKLGYCEEARKHDAGYDRVFLTKLLLPDG